MCGRTSGSVTARQLRNQVRTRLRRGGTLLSCCYPHGLERPAVDPIRPPTEGSLGAISVRYAFACQNARPEFERWTACKPWFGRNTYCIRITVTFSEIIFIACGGLKYREVGRSTWVCG
jgi:hypothetical protein